MMFRAFRSNRVLAFAAAMVVLPLGNLQSAESPDDQKAMRALNQNPPAWGLALTYLLRAHGQDGTNTERYRKIALCLQNTNRPLAAMAWYQAYRTSSGADPQKVEAAAVQVGLLEVDVQAKVGSLFAEAVNIAEKQIKDRVEATGGKSRTTSNLLLLPILQAEAGMPTEALLTQKRIDALKVRPDSHSKAVDSRLRYQYRHTSSLNLRERYVYAAALVGDAATVQGESSRVPGRPLNEEEKHYKSVYGYTPQEEWYFLAELIRFNLSQEKHHRLAWAEQITRRDPMENLDARTGEILRQQDTRAIPSALGSLALEVGEGLLKVRAMRPENAKAVVSAATRTYAARKLEALRLMAIRSAGDEEVEQILQQAASRLKDK